MTLTPLRPARPSASRTRTASTAFRARTLDVAILDDCALVIAGVGEMLRPLVRSVHPATNGPGASQRPVDVTLWDPSPGGALRTEQLPSLLADPRRGRVLLYSLRLSPTMTRELLQRGCAGFVDKSASTQELLEAVLTVSSGDTRGRSAQPCRSGTWQTWPGKAQGLSRREAQVVSLIARGLTNEDIGARLYLSPNTVKSYVRSAYGKLRITRRPEAVRWGMEHGLDVLDAHVDEPLPWAERRA